MTWRKFPASCSGYGNAAGALSRQRMAASGGGSAIRRRARRPCEDAAALPAAVGVVTASSRRCFGRKPRFRVVNDPRKPPAQLNSSRQLSLLIEGGADRGGIGFGDDEHPKALSVHITAGKRSAPPDCKGGHYHIYEACFCRAGPHSMSGHKCQATDAAKRT